jgi:hypothetical protein
MRALGFGVRVRLWSFGVWGVFHDRRLWREVLGQLLNRQWCSGVGGTEDAGWVGSVAETRGQETCGGEVVVEGSGGDGAEAKTRRDGSVAGEATGVVRKGGGGYRGGRLADDTVARSLPAAVRWWSTVARSPAAVGRWWR